MSREVLSLQLSDIDVGVLKEVPYEFARNNRLLVYKREDNRLFGLVCDDNGRFALLDIAKNLGLDSEYGFCAEEK
ncbi:MAG: hypothetical protein WAV13_02465, partial [Thermodesulfovibrionales bacterium]